jgi:hypothetical protein
MRNLLTLLIALGAIVAANLSAPTGASATCMALTGAGKANCGSASSGPAADLQFANGVYTGCTATSCLTNTNSSGGTCTDSTGLVHVIAANTLRNCSGTGLLVEQSSQNLEIQAQNWTTGSTWGNTNSSTTINTTIAPDGTTTGNTVSITSTSSSGGTAQQNISATAGQVYTVSAFLKPGNVNFGFIQVNVYNSGGPGSVIDAAPLDT